ncbi:hypothetical protein [Aneurinibacillus aneurinilyticus]|uniref:Uncharacterized protein n=1 Tax=Aneurinibacillus aneurinilyticus ATCC 12856 TaxID=649747 RepID=U1WYG4_ANEAE|nr:hypothetical protein [Aneurinibacillus aneurinilyticus]ERI07278.1 hypothetical protein HMPREF0083_04653 [Aneurinibacillus aneurinilyticus ATCC 12856]MED0704786.1 hypothetical protein [Aneurinibacillus aneurinilyticus]MED0708683.1 hypothetical protein [Aneurinibacillus aneurinilyticus]MED0723348.1 hypothetical protein [Aneurinibacillus aneurinilyticus]MED0725617.1 hypothetical protein [Aneurinibacillus aneurinilyticus]
MEDLRAFAIGPDRYTVVVGYDEKSVVEWFKKEAGISEEEFKEYDVSEYPMDKKVQLEGCPDKPSFVTTTREWMKDVTKFPAIAFWTE